MMGKGSSNFHGPSMSNGPHTNGQGSTRIIITDGRLNDDAHWWYLI